MKRSCPSGRFDSGKPHGKFNAVDLVEDGGVRFVTPRFLRPPSPAKSGVRPWRRRKLVRKIFVLPPSVALHDSDAAKVLRYEAFQRSKVDPDQLTLDELNEDAVASVKLGHGRDDRVGKFAGVVLLPRMSRPSSPMVQSTPVESIVHLVSFIAVVISNGFCSLLV
jgi:hypothetical protein